MAEATTTNPVNLSQLCFELGGVPLHSIGPTPDGETTISTDAVDVETLAAAVEAHVADPAWVDPKAGPPALTKVEIAAQKVAAVQNGPIREALNAIVQAL